MKKIISYTIIAIISISMCAGCGKTEKDNTSTVSIPEDEVITDEEFDNYEDNNENIIEENIDETASSVSEMTNSTPVSFGDIEISSVSTELTGDILNMVVTLANMTDSDIEFDCSKFKITDKKDSGYNINATTRTIPKNTSYIQYSFTVDCENPVSAGDELNIYYNGTLLKTTQITKI